MAGSLFSSLALAGELRLAVVSDVHVKASGRLAPAFNKIVDHLISRHPKAVIVTGDSTSGNENDTYSEATVRGWWRVFERAIKPLQEAGIAVLPVPGNHDYYRPVHQKMYQEAASRILAANPQVPGLKITGNPPLFYAADLDGAHLDLLPIVDQEVEPRVLKWLVQDLAEAREAQLRLAFGHVPLESVIGHTSLPFQNELGKALVDGGVAAYVAGHEHLVWDTTLDIDLRRLHQITVGTASGTYNFPLAPKVYSEFCENRVCRLPRSGLRFELERATRRQKQIVTFAELELKDKAVEFHPFTLNEEGNIVPFGL